MKITHCSYEIWTELDDKKIGQFIEKCARNCYKSEKAMTEDSYKKIIKDVLIANGHEAMLEHFNITVKLTTDLHSYKDLTRHRHASFAIESTRWCDYSNPNKFKDIEFIEPYGLAEHNGAYNLWKKACEQCEVDYKFIKNAKLSTDIASQFINQSIKADVVMTANIREWRYILKLRTAKGVYPNLRNLMIELLLEFREKLPTFFSDIKLDTDKEPEVLEVAKVAPKKTSKNPTKEEATKDLINCFNNATGVCKEVQDISTKLIKYKRPKDKGILVNGVALDYRNIDAKQKIMDWIQKYPYRLQEMKFFVEVIDKELVNNKTNPNYFYELDLLNNGNLEFIVTRDDSRVKIKKLVGYYEKYKEQFPGLSPKFIAQTIRFE